MNPARSLGPELVLGNWTSWWAYLAGPLIGGLIAVALAHILRGRGGGEFSRNAAQGTIGTVWRPDGPGRPDAPGRPDGPGSTGGAGSET